MHVWDGDCLGVQEIWALQQLAAAEPLCMDSYVKLLDSFEAHGHVVLVRRFLRPSSLPPCYPIV